MNASASLRARMPTMAMVSPRACAAYRRARAPALAPRVRCGRRRPTLRRRLRGSARERAARQRLQAARPARIFDARAQTRRRQIVKASGRETPRRRGQHCRSDAARQRRQRQIERAGFGLHHEPAMAGERVPLDARAEKGRADGCGVRLDHRHRLRSLTRNDGRRAALKNARLVRPRCPRASRRARPDGPGRSA